MGIANLVLLHQAPHGRATDLELFRGGRDLTVVTGEGRNDHLALGAFACGGHRALCRHRYRARRQYFLGQKDPRYVDLITFVDSFPDNPGVQRGGLVEARYGKGRWVYIGLGLWRQLPAGTPGAYQLMANLLSLPKSGR